VKSIVIVFITNCLLILIVKKIRKKQLLFGEIIRCTKMVPFFGPPCIRSDCNLTHRNGATPKYEKDVY